MKGKTYAAIDIGSNAARLLIKRDKEKRGKSDVAGGVGFVLFLL